MTSVLVRSSGMILVMRMSPAAASPAALPGAGAAAAFDVEDLVDPLGHLGRRRVVDRLDPHLIAGPADVDLFDELEHAADVARRCRSR